MVINNVTKDSIVLIVDNVQAKHLVALLRGVTEQQLDVAAKEVEEAGFDNGCPLDSLAAARSFTNIVGYYTDKMHNVPAQPEPEVEAVPEPPTSKYIN